MSVWIKRAILSLASFALTVLVVLALIVLSSTSG
jgi:hypothetical protein